MSTIGQNPKVKWLNLEPQSTTPANPNEGDVFKSDGGDRAEGLWMYENAAWSQISTGASLSTLANLTLTPQSSDPGSPAEGMIFRADGTSRAEGIWEYQNGDWVQISGLRYQEFTLKTPVTVRVATTAALTLASQVENGDTIDGVVLVTNDIVLIKNQVTASENGVYTVNASGAPTRHSSADTFSELNNNYCVYVRYGTTNAAKIFFQTATLTSLSDSQTWSETPANYTLTVPEGVYDISVTATGGGGGGGGGAGNTNPSGANYAASGGGGGGAGCVPANITVPVTPGETITISLGVPGKLGRAGAASTSAEGAGDGGTTIVIPSTSSWNLYAVGADGGGGGTFNASFTVPGVGGVGGSGAAGGALAYTGLLYTDGGPGVSSIAPSSSDYADNSLYAPAGAHGANVTSGGGGGAGYSAGGAGGNGYPSYSAGSSGTNGSGGGGGGGSAAGGGAGEDGACGGGGYVRISWS